ncbi:MAG: hypothetical protein ING84_15420 [Cytophagales bacterium]|jgi:hypothetical protein|nr:hypothetical protein [Cytophagales bacterium]MCE2893007.1 hypothetical protein [Flammeovirgaceae bacterium]MCA6368104.1 hypothetical protein [Cytophagales bacterium]MCA6370618.1 hypothetical protein [Cytophagales bacterium]MCA6375711.1 hypothetical protein [Cytophagales bacterium]
METKKSSRFGKYALAIGIAAGFVFLAALFTVLDSSSGISDTMICVAIAASSMSVFLSSMETQKKKSCKISTPKV